LDCEGNFVILLKIWKTMGKINAKEGMEALKEGNARFVSGELSQKANNSELREQLGSGQQPFAVVLCCSDSRVAPEIIFDQRLGDLFVIRNAGNVVDKLVLGSIEYAVEHLGSPLVVVLGHSSCGAVTATCQGGELQGQIAAIVRRIRQSVGEAGSIDDNARSHAKRMARLIGMNPVVRHEKVQVVAAFYDIRSGVVEWM